MQFITGRFAALSLTMLVAALGMSAASAANRPAGYVTICAEGKTCSVATSTNVAFGRADKFFYKVLTGSFVCNEATFGGRIAGGNNECSAPSGSSSSASSSKSSASSSSSSRSSSSIASSSSSSKPGSSSSSSSSRPSSSSSSSSSSSRPSSSSSSSSSTNGAATIGKAVADYMLTQWLDVSSSSCGTKCFSLDYSTVPASPNPKGWEYTNGVAMGAIWKLYLKTGDTRYYDYVKKFVDKYVSSSGSVPTSSSQDVLQPSVLLPGLYDKTKDARYLTAMKSVRSAIDSLKKNTGGAFWHKSNYPNQQWLDGLYMTEPFLATYAARYADGVKSGDSAVAFNIVTTQFKIANQRLTDSSKKLPYHAWLGSSDGVWQGLSPGNGKTPPLTGQVVSPILWSRAIGWYFAGLMDVLEVLPANHADRAQLVSIANTLAQGLIAQQDAGTGLWYQVIDVRNNALPSNGGYPNENIAAQPNWLETSASALFTYGLAKGARLGVLPSSSRTAAEKGWTGLKTKVVISGSNVTVKDAVAGMSVGGTYNAYVNADFRTDLSSGPLPAPKDKCSTTPATFTSHPLACKYIYVRDNVPQAVGAVMLASSELEY